VQHLTAMMCCTATPVFPVVIGWYGGATAVSTTPRWVRWRPNGR
jgi:hypothetical protein